MDGAYYVRLPEPHRSRDVVAYVLAVGLVVALSVTAVGAVLHRGPISAEESALLSTSLGATVGALATYLGQQPPRPPKSPEDSAQNGA
jgi:hypothetical protein